MEKEFVWVWKEYPHLVDSIDPVSDFAETKTSFVMRANGYDYAVKKDDLLAWEYRDFTRDEDGRTPPPSGYKLKN